jgi:hypothetical protein
MSTVIGRTDYHARMQPYWSARTPHLGLKHWEMSKVHGDSRTCAYCGEEYPLEEFWTGSRLSYVCSSDRGRSRKRRKEVEQEAVEQNDQSDQDQSDQDQSDQDQSDQDESDQDESDKDEPEEGDEDESDDSDEAA